MGVLKERALKHILDTEKEEELEAPPTKNETESDEVESDYVHTSDCEIYTTGECTCS
jgi:hypothetical protein